MNLMTMKTPNQQITGDRNIKSKKWAGRNKSVSLELRTKKRQLYARKSKLIPHRAASPIVPTVVWATEQSNSKLKGSKVD